MSELKAYTFSAMERTGLADYYLKEEADKVIAELEESHKKEVGQLLMEIEEQKRLRDMALASVPNVLKVMKIIQHHKYKRCLAMARMCSARHDEEDTKVNGHGASWDYTSKEMKYWKRWRQRWLDIAEKFKEAK